MADEAGSGRVEGAGRSRIAVAGGIAGGLVLIGIAAAWIERAPIAVHFVDRSLAARGVPARYRLVAIGPIGQRLEDVSIGDPAAPDLTARVIELRLGYGFGGPYLTAVRAQGVRLSARIADGRVSFGTLDRLLAGRSSKTPLALPDLAVTLADGRIDLATPAGAIRALVDGDGNLADGFRGRVRADSPGLTLAGCSIDRPTAAIAVRIVRAAPMIDGPLDLAGAACPGTVAVGPGRMRLAMAFAPTLDRWRGSLAPAGFAGAGGGVRFGALAGRMTIAGDARRSDGTVALAAAGIHGRYGRAALLRADGQYRFAPGRAGLIYAGDLAIGHGAASDDLRRPIAAAAGALDATPLGPIAQRATRAVAMLLADADARGTIAFTAGGPAGIAARIRRLTVTGASGGGIRLAEGAGIGRAVREAGWRLDGRIAIGGGGLPDIAADLRQGAAGGPVAGVARITPYATGDARLALTPVRFETDGRTTRISGVATIDGPIAGGGRIAGLTVPIDARIDPRGFAVGAGCTPVAFRALAFVSLTLAPGRVRVCGIGGAPILARRDGGAMRAAASLSDVALAGRSGTMPLTLAARSVRIDRAGFAGDGIAVRLGGGDAVTRLDIGTLRGDVAGAIGGAYAGAAGQIAAVPLAFAEAAGTWRIGEGGLSLEAGLSVADAAAAPRFRPLAGRDVRLTLRAGRVAASGRLVEPRSGAALADITLTHDLAAGRGGAVLTVPALTFDKRLQPDMLTPATLGVIANVAGTIRGGGRIDWSPAGLTSSGDFATEHIDLAAAFGPVTGIAGTIHFSDLLAIETPPGQSATIAEVNPGIAVSGGTVRYRLLAGQRVTVEGARWPFAGGTLLLEPTMLTFGEASERHLTFRLAALNAGAFVQQFDFPNLAATGTFDGALPMIFDDKGGRIVGGRIVARPPGGTIAYVGPLGRERVGLTSKLVFDALKSIRYSSLSIGLDGRLDGEIVSHVAFQGIRQATPDAGIVARMIRNLPFRFNIAVRAPFRALLGTARSYGDPSLLLQGGLPRPGDTISVPPIASTPDIQPAESEPVR